jgi:hypothetical protein
MVPAFMKHLKYACHLIAVTVQTVIVRKGVCTALCCSLFTAALQQHAPLLVLRYTNNLTDSSTMQQHISEASDNSDKHLLAIAASAMHTGKFRTDNDS